MAILSLGNKTVLTQTGSAEPILKNTVQVESGITLPSPTVSNPTFKTGTFTPQLVKVGETGPVFADNTYSIQEGFYQKMGKLVFITGQIMRNASVGNTYASGKGSGNAIGFDGLPFLGSLQSANDAQWNQGNIQFYFTSMTGYSASYQMYGLVRTQDPRDQIGIYYDGSDGGVQQTAAVFATTNATIIFTGFYFTDDND
tara:strand:- start:509 stop:1105 length:597 start_codon:yes stop_codon:yes gene_type:complete